MLAGEPIPTTLDLFLGGKLVLRQPYTGYRAGFDPVFLAAAVTAFADAEVLDMGSGIGTAGLCLLARLPTITVTGVELQPPLADLARQNAAANGLEGRYQVVEGCLASRPLALRGRAFDHVITNPPWYEPGTIRPPRADSKATGHLEGSADLDEWLKAASRYLKPKGQLWLIHRADHLGRIMAGLAGLPLGEIRVVPVWPKRNRAATRVLVTARKDSKAPMELLPGLVAHDEDGAYSQAAEAILREGSAWHF